jgi:hypothetical protein
MLVAGTGEVVAMSLNGTNSAPVSTITDIWDAGSVGGVPSRTITHAPNGTSYIINGAITHSGTLYLTYSASAGVSYDVIPPGASTPTRTIVESQVSPSNQYAFFPNYEAVAADGTLYVTVWTFGQQPETYAGLYTYLPDGSEALPQPIPGGPQGVDVDGSGNVYVTVNNSNSSTTASADTSHALNIYTPHAASLTRSVTGSWLNAYPLAVASNGTAYFTTFGANGVWSLLPGATTATNLSAANPVSGNDIILYDGSRETTVHARSAQSIGSNGGSHGGGTRHL